MTAAGSRLLAQRLAAPLTEPEAIARRHDAVAHFVADAGMRGAMRATLQGRARSRPCAVAAGGRPRRPARPCRHSRRHRRGGESRRANSTAGGAIPAEVAQAAAALRKPDAAIARELAAALDDELPLFKRDGGFVRTGL